MAAKRATAFLATAPLNLRPNRSFTTRVVCNSKRPLQAKASDESSSRFYRRRIFAGVLALSGMLLLNPFNQFSRADVQQLTRTDEQWQMELTPAQYQVLRQAGTERPFSSPLNKEKRIGVYACAGCAHKLYESAYKYDSGTGWPSFFKACDEGVELRETTTDRLLRQREVLCARCGGHLGHVFRDGPRPTGLRYCMNGVAMKFIPKGNSS